MPICVISHVAKLTCGAINIAWETHFPPDEQHVELAVLVLVLS